MIVVAFYKAYNRELSCLLFGQSHEPAFSSDDSYSFQRVFPQHNLSNISNIQI